VLLTLLWLLTQGRPRHLLEASTEQSPPAVTMPVVKPPMPDGPPVAAQPQAAGAASVSAADAPQAADTPPAPVPLPAAAKSVDAIQWAGESDDAAAAIAEPVHGRGATPAPLVAAETPSRSYPFSLLLGSYSSEDQARQAVQTHRANGLDSFWVKIDLGAKNIRYRVFGGYFETAEQAEEAAVRHRLSPGAVKATRYAIMVGQKADGHHAKALIQMLQDQGYCPYGIADQSGRVSVYLGAFYTLKGAQLHANEMALTQLEGLQVVKR
jgi:cell division septation protein DedD